MTYGWKRNQVDRIKGGRLSRRLVPAKMCHILAVDCNYGNTGAPGYIGLTRANVWLHSLPDVSTKEWAAGVLMKWGAWDLVDPSIRAYLGNPEAGEDTLRAEEFEIWDCYIFGIMPDTQAPVPAAMKKAAELGYTPHLLSRAHELEAGVMGKFYAQLGAGVANFNEPFEAPCAIFFTGEMVVTVGDSDGVGGRNQECALAAATSLGGNKRVVFASVDTDGTDGPGGEFNAEATAKGCVNLTGGIVDGFTMAEAKEKNVNVAGALKTHAASDALWQLDSGIWATQNISVQDLGVILVMPKE